MSLPIPNLDDRSFDDLMKEARSLIPIYNKEWTNHNPSDPGITLLELFAWLCEMVIYRIDQVPEENYRRFLALIGIEYVFRWGQISGEGGEEESSLREFLEENYDAGWVSVAKIEKTDTDNEKMIRIFAGKNLILLERDDEENQVTMTFDTGKTHTFTVKREKGEFIIYDALENDIRSGLALISRRYRAISADDYEFLALECMENLQKGLAGRAICMNNRNLEYDKDNKNKPYPGHVSVIIIPNSEGYTFNWDKISNHKWDKIPSQDDLTLRVFLMKNFEADWMREAIIEISNEGKTILILQEYFKVTDQFLEELVAENIPENIINLLKNIKNQIYTSEEEFAKALESTIGEDAAQAYQSAILIHAVERNFISLELHDQEKVIMTSNLYRSYEFAVKPDGQDEIPGKKVWGYCKDANTPSDLLKDKVEEYLNKRRLVTTRVHVAAPDYRTIRLKLVLVLKENTVKQDVVKDAKKLIYDYFDPLIGGQDGRGWPLGRNIYRSEIYHLLEGIPGIDHVVKVLINGNDDNFVVETYELMAMGKIEIEVHNE